MTTDETISYGPKQITEMIIRERGISDGYWMLSLEFGLVAANTGPSPDEIYPSAIIPVQKIGIARSSEPNPMTVDASKVREFAMNGGVKSTPAKAKAAPKESFATPQKRSKAKSI